MILKLSAAVNRFLPFLLFMPLAVAAQKWSQLSDFPGAGRDDGVSYTIQEKPIAAQVETPDLPIVRIFTRLI